jgi:hypothetical protein
VGSDGGCGKEREARENSCGGSHHGAGHLISPEYWVEIYIFLGILASLPPSRTGVARTNGPMAG